MKNYILIDPVGNHLGAFKTEEEAWAWQAEHGNARGAYAVRRENSLEEIEREAIEYCLRTVPPTQEELDIMSTLKKDKV